jgi:hypothetical protein
MAVDTSSSISLQSVSDALRSLQSDHSCNCRFEMTIPSQAGSTVVVWVKLVAEPRSVAKRTIRAPTAVSLRWPHVDHRTLAGLMFRLAYDLGVKLDAIGHVPAEQALFGWGEE